MKKKVLGLVIAVMGMAMMFTSCNKAEKLIVGTWVSNELSYVEATINGEPTDRVRIDNITFTFNEDGTTNNPKTTYTIDGDKLTIVSEGETNEYDIITLDKKVLVLESVYEETTYGTTFKTLQHLEFDKQ